MPAECRSKSRGIDFCRGDPTVTGYDRRKQIRVARMENNAIPGDPPESGNGRRMPFKVAWNRFFVGATQPLSDLTDEGKYGHSGEFNNLDDSVNMGSNSSLDDIETQGNGGLTIAAWIYPRTQGLGNGGHIVCKDDSGGTTGEWCLRLHGTAQLNFDKDYSTANLSYLTEINSISVGLWNFVVLTWNGGNSASNDVVIYVNNNKNLMSGAGAWTQDGSGTKPSEAARNLYIGNDVLAKEAFQKALEIDSESTGAKINLAGFYLYYGHTAKAHKIYDSLPKSDKLEKLEEIIHPRARELYYVQSRISKEKG